MESLARMEKNNESAKGYLSLIQPLSEYRDITFEPCWSLSSCKAEGYGIAQLLNPRIENYWQSDGGQPHRITLEFQKKTEVCFLLFYLDFRMDESYTPSKISIHHGSSVLDLGNPRIEQFQEPSGWVRVDLRERGPDCFKPIRTFVIQISILQNHQNGRDTHIRGIRVIGPNSKGLIDPAKSILGDINSSRRDIARTYLAYQREFKDIPEIGGHRIR